MADDNVGCTTRSKARSEKSAAANVTATTMRGASTSSTKGSNRSRNENILRRQRVEYEADEERAKLLEERVKLLEEQIKLKNEQSKRQAELTEVRLQIIKKKLAMQLAEIESDVEEEKQIYDIQQVDEWLNEKHKPRMSTPKNPSIHAHHAAPAQPLPAPPTPEERVVDREHDSIESIDIMWNNKRSEFMQLPPKTVKTDETDVSNVQVIGNSYIRGWPTLLLFLLAFWSMLRPGQPLLYKGIKNKICKIYNDKYFGICKRKVSLVLYNIMWRALRHQPKKNDLSPFKLRYFKQGFMNSKVKYFVYKCKRIAWKFKSLKCVISAVDPGRDNQVRVVSIKTAKGCTYNVETEC